MLTPTSAAIRRCKGGHVLLGGVVLAGFALLASGGCGRIAAQRKNAEGVRLYDQTRYQDAAYRFWQAANDDPKNADAYYNLAAAYHRMGVVNQDPSLLQQAERYYNQCLDHDEDHCDCYRSLAVLLVEQDRSEEAFRLLEGWADRNPSSAEARIELARLFEEFGDQAAAREHLLAAISVDHTNPRAFAALGRIREQTGEYSAALADYRQSLWYDRFQPEVAARVATLQTAVAPSEAFPATPGQRIVSAPSATRRY